MLIRDFIIKANRDFPEKEAVISGDRRLTYSQIFNRIQKLSSFFSGIGLSYGDVISVLHHNSLHYFELYFACALNGIILNSINTRLSAKEINFILKDSNSKLLTSNFSGHIQFSDENHIRFISSEKQFEDIIKNQRYNKIEFPEIAPDDPAHLYYTSGTTGKPKGVILTNKNVCTHSLNAIKEFDISNNDVWLHAAPMFHLADAWATFALTGAGAKHIMLEKFSIDRTFELIQKEKVTISNMIPTMLNLLINDKKISNYDLSSLRVILSGGAPIAPGLIRKIIENFGCDYIQTYGMTETSPYLTVSILNEKLKKLSYQKQLKYKSKTGRPFLGVTLKVVSDDGNEIQPNDKEVGEIIVNGDTVTPGYWNLPDETQKRIKKGWLYTEDLATIDKEGFVNIVDRKSDMIITGGENVYSIEVENALYDHPDILETAVIGIPDEIWGEKIKAFVVLKKDKISSTDEIINFLSDKIAKFKIPSEIVFLNSLPKTGSGKITKTELRKLK